MSKTKNAGFGTLPVFLTAISTILGAILFLRFGWAIGQVGFWGVIGIIILGHLIAIPTAMAVAEIATNQKVMGGGAYYIISRSFGLNIGAAIGLTLYLSQAISVAFYVIAFSEAFDPVIKYIAENWGWLIYDKRLISIPTMAILSIVFLTKGANVGMKVLYFVVAILIVSLLMFLFGHTLIPHNEYNLSAHVKSDYSYFQVFTIIFPAFTGLAAGLGLSGDLRDPKKSIPRGTIWATFVGLVIYILVAFKLAISADPSDLSSDQLIMQRIAVWGPIIPIGLAAASMSSALGSIMVAPRTLQAIGLDKIIPNFRINSWIAKGKGETNEPQNSSIVTIIIAFFFVIIGDVNFVAQIISMFFMVTYGAICAISFLEHFAADPAYRPTFKSKWYFSLAGGLLSIWLMFKMNMPYAILSILIMTIIYYAITKTSEEKQGIGKLFKGVVFQLSRQLQVFAQRADKEDRDISWRPFVICVSQDTFKRRSAFDFLRWISYKYGFGTYIHYIKGMLNAETTNDSKKVLSKLINLASGNKNRVYLDTIISPSYTSALAQVVQISGVTGKGNNMILFEFARENPNDLQNTIDNFDLFTAADLDICILNTSYKGFGYNKDIHIWITVNDFENANLMILIAYILLGHPEWKNGIIKIFAIFSSYDIELEKEKLNELIKTGQLPISSKNITVISSETEQSNSEIISKYSNDADLTIVGFLKEDIDKNNVLLFNQYPDVGNVLFVNSAKEKKIK